MIALGWLTTLLLLPVLAWSGGSPSAPPSPATPPAKSDKQIQEEKAKAAALARKRKGRSATILAGDPDFLAPSEPAGKVRLGD